MLQVGFSCYFPRFKWTDTIPLVLAHSIPFSPATSTEALEQVPARSGVFLLVPQEPGAEPYVSKASNLRRRIQRLLAPPETQSKRLNLRERCREIQYTITGSDLENVLLLYRTLRQVFPHSYAKRLKLNPATLVRLHWENAYPRAYVTRRLGKISSETGASLYYGPFLSRAAADKYLNDVLDLFKSRRCTFELHPDPSFPGCVYSEMKMCLAPCFKGCTDEEYMAEVGRVQQFLDSSGESLTRQLAEARDKASSATEFEEAAALHARMEKVKSIARSADEIVRRLDRLDAIIVQPAAEPDSVALFRFSELQFIGPVLFTVHGMMPANEASGSSSLYTQPFMPQPIGESVATKAKPVSLESRLKEVVETMQPKPKLTVAEAMEQLSILKRWYYRTIKTGEIFLADERNELPMRRIVRGVSRAITGEKPPS